MYDHTFYKQVQISRSDIRPQSPEEDWSDHMQNHQADSPLYVLIRTLFESHWGRISVAVRWCIWPRLVSDWLAGGLSEQTQPTTRLACSNGHECKRLGNDCKQFRLSHKPGLAGLNCKGWQYNKRNFTLLYKHCYCYEMRKLTSEKFNNLIQDYLVTPYPVDLRPIMLPLKSEVTIKRFG